MNSQSSTQGHPAFQTAEQLPVGEAQLVMLAGQEVGRKYALTLPAVLGRGSDATILIEDGEVSRAHARIFAQGGDVLIEDLGSRNGTFVGNVPIDEPTVIRYGDKIALGSRVRLVYTRWDPQEDQMLQRQRLEVLGKLAAGVAHDLSNTLCGALVTIEYLCQVDREEKLGNTDVRECLGDLLIAIRQAAALAPRVRDLARNTAPAEDASLDIGGLLGEVVAVARRTMGPRIDVVTEIEPDLIVRGSSVELHQAIMNICVNAQEAMPDGGRLRIVCASDRAERVAITVTDTGRGMDEITRSRIFEPFFSTKRADRRSGSGLGLGLATAHEVVKAHGGTIEVASELGRGTTFVLHLPRARPPAADSAPPVDEVIAISTGFTILVVDDSLAVRRSVARMLRTAGYTVDVARRGVEALERLASPPHVDLAIVDEVLPDMRGSELIAQLLARGSTTRVLHVSGSVRIEGKHVLLKPWTSEALLAAVRGALSDSVRATLVTDGLAERVTAPDLREILGRPKPAR
jgi:signal transduction histidine kinase/CheY-like chemotaxis protein